MENSLDLIHEEPAANQNNRGESEKSKTNSRIAFHPKNRLGNFIQVRVHPQSENLRNSLDQS